MDGKRRLKGQHRACSAQVMGHAADMFRLQCMDPWGFAALRKRTLWMACSQQHWGNRDPSLAAAGGRAAWGQSKPDRSPSFPARYLPDGLDSRMSTAASGPVPPAQGRDPTPADTHPIRASASATAASTGAPPRYKASPTAAAAIPFVLQSAPPPCGQEYLPPAATPRSPSRNTNPPALIAAQGACNLQPGSLHAAAGVAALPARVSRPAFTLRPARFPAPCRLQLS